MSAAAEARVAGDALLAGYDRAMPQVYGYLVARVGTPAVAEDLTSETFLAGVAAIQAGTLREPSVAWLIGVARHKLVDHWRRQEREQRRLKAVADLTDDVDDPWDIRLDVAHAHATLATLGAHHRRALVLRYLDGLSVPEVAAALDRTVGATEQVLVRARRAFRVAYEAVDGLPPDRFAGPDRRPSIESDTNPEGGAR